MTTRPPAEIGMPLEEVETPALLLDLDAFERNLARMAAALEGTGVRLRPHAKTHKCPTIARHQVARGAVGVCCQKVGEAEAMVQGGIADVLVSNEVVGARKLQRLAALAREARVAVCVDDVEQIDALDRVAAEFGVKLRVLVEIDVGTGRCGVVPGEPAATLAASVAERRNLSFAGLQAYHGAAQHVHGFAERRAAIGQAVGQVEATLEALQKKDLACEMVSGGGTGSYNLESASGVYTELQAGSYIFMDVEYADIESATGATFGDFEHSLFVYATVMSRTATDRAVLDAGLKAFSTERGMPRVHDLEGAEAVRVSDEHTKLVLAEGANAPRLGEKLMLIPGHCDPTVNLHDWYVGVRAGRVEALWPITARGASL